VRAGAAACSDIFRFSVEGAESCLLLCHLRHAAMTQKMKIRFGIRDCVFTIYVNRQLLSDDAVSEKLDRYVKTPRRRK
jgi:hypothetical protein